MTTIARGRDLPNSPHRRAAELYVTDRGIENLRKLGVAPDVLTVARRGDDLLDPTSSGDPPRRDGILTVFELDRLDEAANKAALFPDEAAAVPSVHRLFEIPASNQVALKPVKNLEYILDRKLVTPAVTSLLIADLPQELQKSAKRLQLVRDGDGNPDTIQRDDILWAKNQANIGAFTAETVGHLDRILGMMHDDIFEEKAVGILPPYVQHDTLLAAGPVQVKVGSRVGFKTGNGPHAPYTWNPVLHRRELEIDAPADYKIFLKGTSQIGANVAFYEEVIHGTGAPQVAEAHALLSSPGASLWIQVVDNNGALVTNARVEFPVTQLEPFNVPANLRRRKVQEWRDIHGNVVNHKANGDRGIPGYSLDGHPHLFAREMINTTP